MRPSFASVTKSRSSRFHLVSRDREKDLTNGAVVSYTDSFGKQEREVEYAKMRYPNGEGPWADWIDSTGYHKIKAGYHTR